MPKTIPKLKNNEKNIIGIFDDYTLKCSPSLFSFDKEKVEWIEKNGVLFYPGVHNGREFSFEDIKKLFNNYKGDLPFNKDHNDWSVDSIVGTIKKVWLVGEYLHCTVRIFEKKAIENTLSRLWSRISASINIGTMTLEGASFVVIPALPEASLYNVISKNIQFFSIGELYDGKLNKEVKNMPDIDINKIKKEGEENQVKIEPEIETSLGSSKVQNFKLKPEPDLKLAKVQFSQQDFLDMQKENLVDKTRILQLEKANQLQKDDEVVKNFVREGKILPAGKDGNLIFYNSLSEDQKAFYIKEKQEQKSLFPEGVINIKTFSKSEKEESDARDKADMDEILGNDGGEK